MNKINFSELVSKELARVRMKVGPQNSCHEGYAILLEEVDELWDEVKKKRSMRDPQAMLAELVQIGSCAQKMVEDVIIPMIDEKS